MSQKVAILIPTMNRVSFLERQLKYYHDSKSIHPIYIGDASSQENAKENQKIIKRFQPYLSIKYYYWHNKTDRETLYDLACQVEEKYTVFIADDDFLIPQSLTNCAHFLSENREYRSAQGRGVLFTLKDIGAYGKLSCCGDYWKKPQAEENSAMARIRRFSLNYWVPQFSVKRSDDFLEDLTNYRDITDKGFGELINSFQIIANGKSKFLDCLYLVRQGHQERYLIQDLNTRRKLKTYQESLVVFLDTITKAICKQDALQYDDVFPQVKAFYHDVYLKNSKKSIWKKLSSRLRRFISRVFVTKNMRKFIQMQRAKKGLLNHYALNDKAHKFFGDYQGILNSLKK